MQLLICSLYSSGRRRPQGLADRQRPHQEVLLQGIQRPRRPPRVLRRVRITHRPRPRCRPRNHRPEGRHPRRGAQEEPQPGMFGTRKMWGWHKLTIISTAGHRDLDRQQAALLQGEPGEAFPPHAFLRKSISMVAWDGINQNAVD